jgi:poly(3-hydroxybutyrate) depolymerase
MRDPMLVRSRLTAAVLGLVVLSAGAGQATAMVPADAPARLAAYRVDPAGTSVSGLSSGAFMAVQFQVAFSGSLLGAGVIAGGPYHCAEGQPELALKRCMATSDGVPDAKALIEYARTQAAAGRIDPLEHLARSRVYLFGGSIDPVVTPPVIGALREFYRLAGIKPENLLVKTDIPAGHAFVTADFGSACGQTETPFINDCGYDQAGAILGHLYGQLTAPTDAPGGRLIAFDQSEFLRDPLTHGLDTSGYLYVPAACAAGERCRVHVALHGCLQGRERLGQLYPTRTGYNRWAESNRLLILYPQAVATASNPQGCWDWFAYDGPDYALKSGRQMAAVKGMVDRLSGLP